MAKRCEIFKALRANGWKYCSCVKGTLNLSKGSNCICLYLDSMDYGTAPDFSNAQYVWVGWELANIRVQGTKLILPEMEGTGPYCS